MSEQIRSWLSSQRDAMLGLMEKVVNIDSGFKGGYVAALIARKKGGD